ncbi:MAG: transcription antitermination factor NusB [Chitinophagaceae bacterium]|nr:transcription antitermination factor NusB [Chitinophagaceae bacterium]MCW5905001.1 transcription antitermination factor NusB [Chitinophagaceae bacterium]
MISRRNIRIKVMQLLYMIESSGDKNLYKDPIAQLQKNVGKTTELLVYLIHYLTEVVRYVETDARHRASKNLPTYEDLHVNTKIAGNIILWQLLENESLVHAIKNDNTNSKVDSTTVRKIYIQLAETAEYKNYINEPTRDRKADKEILAFIFNSLILPNELFEEQTDELFNNWDDDAEMMQQLVNTFIQKPTNTTDKLLTDETWSFGKLLLQTAIEKNNFTLELIKPKLKNWDSERIAVLDMILMQMGVCELLYFETIPTKVTINEYIDLAKSYSTPQSGQFVNGILDNIHKELIAEGKINKVDFKKKGRWG